MLLVNVVVDVIKWLTGSKKSEVPLVEILVQKIAVFLNTVSTHVQHST